MKNYETLIFDKRDAIVTITLSRENNANGINAQLANELASAAHECEQDNSIKAVILTGSGRFFCAGGDVKAMAAYGDQIEEKMHSLATALHKATVSFANMRPPLIVAVNGAAAGAGFSMAIMGDLVVASQSATFMMAYTSIGLTPDGGASFYLPRIVGLRKAQELMLCNRALNAEEALEWGLINRVVAPEALMETAKQLAQNFCNGASQANHKVQQLLMASWGNSLEAHLDLEARYISESSAGKDGREGIGAFVEKRPAKFE